MYERECLDGNVRTGLYEPDCMNEDSRLPRPRLPARWRDSAGLLPLPVWSGRPRPLAFDLACVERTLPSTSLRACPEPVEGAGSVRCF